MSTKKERTQVIENLTKEFERAAGIFLTDINLISVAKMTKLRANLRGKGSRYIVLKNSLAKKALERCGKEKLIPYLKGPIGAAIGFDDSLAPIRVIKDFKKENKELLEIRAAYVDGTLFTPADALKLADLPGREVLLSMLLSALQAPIANLAGALTAILSTFVGTLESVKKQKEGQP